MFVFATMGIAQADAKDSAFLLSAQTTCSDKVRMPRTAAGPVSPVTRVLVPTRAYREAWRLAMLAARTTCGTTTTATCCSQITVWQPTLSRLMGSMELAGGVAFQQLRPMEDPHKGARRCALVQYHLNLLLAANLEMRHSQYIAVLTSAQVDMKIIWTYLL